LKILDFKFRNALFVFGKYRMIKISNDIYIMLAGCIFIVRIKQRLIDYLPQMA